MLKRVKKLTLTEIVLIIICIVFVYISVFHEDNVGTGGWERWNKPFKDIHK